MRQLLAQSTTAGFSPLRDSVLDADGVGAEPAVIDAEEAQEYFEAHLFEQQDDSTVEAWKQQLASSLGELPVPPHEP